ncbi:MAG: Asp-tRNA(Asn)/Glu-tRNA(Gln) amidotransferase subunit GatC [Candidatus Omnitrophota bacterium]
MAISKKDVKYVADLARVELTEEELNQFAKQLENIIEYIDKLKKLDISAVEATTHVLNIKNVFRDDVVKPSLNIVEFLKSIPKKEGTFFKVPKVIE